MKTLVILDNEPGSTEGMEGILQRHGFLIVPVAAAAEAAAIAGSADLLIAGFDESGDMSAIELHEVCPETPLLLVSETPLDRWPEKEFLYFKALSSRTDFLRKPLSAGSFVTRVNALLYNSSYSAGRKTFEDAAANRVPPVPA